MPGALYSPSMQAEIAKADNWYPMIANANPNIVSIDKLWQTTRDTPFYTPREAFRIAARGTLDQDSILGIVNALPEDSIISRRFFQDRLPANAETVPLRPILGRYALGDGRGF